MQRFQERVGPAAARQSLRKAFTIIEMAVVLGVLAILLALLLPTVQRARELANRAVCASNLRQIGVACRMYANDHEGLFPGHFHIPLPATALKTNQIQNRYSFPGVLSDDDLTPLTKDLNPGSTRW